MVIPLGPDKVGLAAGKIEKLVRAINHQLSGQTGQDGRFVVSDVSVPFAYRSKIVELYIDEGWRRVVIETSQRDGDWLEFFKE